MDVRQNDGMIVNNTQGKRGIHQKGLNKRLTYVPSKYISGLCNDDNDEAINVRTLWSTNG